MKLGEHDNSLDELPLPVAQHTLAVQSRHSQHQSISENISRLSLHVDTVDAQSSVITGTPSPSGSSGNSETEEISGEHPPGLHRAPTNTVCVVIKRFMDYRRNKDLAGKETRFALPFYMPLILKGSELFEGGGLAEASDKFIELPHDGKIVPIPSFLRWCYIASLAMDSHGQIDENKVVEIFLYRNSAPILVRTFHWFAILLCIAAIGGFFFFPQLAPYFMYHFLFTLIFALVLKARFNPSDPELYA